LARYRLRKPCFRLCITPERRKAAYRGPWYRLGRGLFLLEKMFYHELRFADLAATYSPAS
ncbi:hypothetical protein, partial [Agrobacterium rosae]|uniref:hypothetical protein n=1 Tax=Agrobacterium rosae TaxID=1972867 RepID=UPI003BA2F2F3